MSCVTQQTFQLYNHGCQFKCHSFCCSGFIRPSHPENYVLLLYNVTMEYTNPARRLRRIKCIDWRSTLSVAR